jgi:hypothetical protein
MPNVDNSSINGIRYTTGCGLEDGAAMDYTVAKLQVPKTGIKTASV